THRRGDYDLLWSFLTKRFDGSSHGRARGQSIIDDDDDAVPHLKRCTRAAIEPFASLEFAQFINRNAIDLLIRNPDVGQHVVVEYPHATAGYRAHRQFFMAGNPELSYREDIERRVQFLRDLIRHGNASAWQSK